METRLRGSATSVPQALLLLLLLGVHGQGNTSGRRCDCAGDFQKRYGPFCCRGCPVGHYLNAFCTEPCGESVCLPCRQGSFLARENHSETQCTRCQSCDEEAFQVALENCSAVADTLCGCPPGWLVDCSTKPCRKSSPFRCLPCPDCKTPSLLLSHPDTYHLFFPCLPGFYEYNNSCLSCLTTVSSCPKACAAVCGWRQMFWVQVLVVPLLLGATLIYTYHRCQSQKPVVPGKSTHVTHTFPRTTHLSASESAHALLAPPGNRGKVCTEQFVGHSWTPGFPQTQKVPFQQIPQPWDQLSNRGLGPSLALPHSPAPPAGSPAAMLQPGPQLYDVMDAVPARRWKEFVRTLGLREAEIEAVEVEIGRFRDQQYEMLKRWRQQQPAGLGAIYAALERMGLEGCAEDLRIRLQRGP
uniref:Tumor necrosis factor receptor superfamily, member 25 n=1 Tax=Jaculus jaculus TaxID=51337 RepID=A0A8C5KPM8_JACJA